MIPVRSQWGRYNLPIYIYILYSYLVQLIFLATEGQVSSVGKPPRDGCPLAWQLATIGSLVVTIVAINQTIHCQIFLVNPVGSTVWFYFPMISYQHYYLKRLSAVERSWTIIQKKKLILSPSQSQKTHRKKSWKTIISRKPWVTKHIQKKKKQTSNIYRHRGTPPKRSETLRPATAIARYFVRRRPCPGSIPRRRTTAGSVADLSGTRNRENWIRAMGEVELNVIG